VQVSQPLHPERRGRTTKMARGCCRGRLRERRFGRDCLHSASKSASPHHHEHEDMTQKRAATTLAPSRLTWDWPWLVRDARIPTQCDFLIIPWCIFVRQFISTLEGTVIVTEIHQRSQSRGFGVMCFDFSYTPASFTCGVRPER
jgi:hypothetical protein